MPVQTSPAIERVDVAGEEDDVLDPLLRRCAGAGARARAGSPARSRSAGTARRGRGWASSATGRRPPSTRRRSALSRAFEERRAGGGRASSAARSQLRARERERVAARLVVAVLALVEHHQLDRAPVPLACGRSASGRAGTPASTRRTPGRRRRGGRARSAARSGSPPSVGVVGVVVLDLVVVPGGDHREALRAAGAATRRCGRARTSPGTPAASPPRAGSVGSTGSACRSGRRAPRARRRPRR